METVDMSLDSSLKTKGGLAGKRSVLSRAERVAKMVADKKIDTKKDGALSLRKTRCN
jgi:small basic protein (TIGR04137 family)